MGIVDRWLWVGAAVWLVPAVVSCVSPSPTSTPDTLASIPTASIGDASGTTVSLASTPVSTGQPSSATPSPGTIQTATPSGPATASATAQPAKSGPADPKEIAAKAGADLAKSLSIDEGSVSIERVQEVQWRDPSLGCPKEGAMYAQVVTPGFQIHLSAGGREYVYNSDQVGNVVTCEHPQPPLSGGATR